MQKNFLTLGVCLISLAGCTPTITTSLTKVRYEEVLHASVCEAVGELNSAGKLKDPVALTESLTRTLDQKLTMEQITPEDWLVTEKKYFSAEEREKLIKFDLTMCIFDFNDA